MKKKVNIQKDVTSRESIENKIVQEVTTLTVIDFSTEVKEQDDKSETDKEQKTDAQPEPKEQKKANGKTKRNS